MANSVSAQEVLTIFPTRFPTELLNTGWEMAELDGLATCQKPLNFGTKRNCKIQGKMGRNGLGNRCSIRLSCGTVI